mmetsp:Transcript_67157/g.185042  ORF Transcript_67157/g.185042 Transcript_67157/m.185042 type:complete len:356 (-) Transcript_67157:23-1090(-)
MLRACPRVSTLTCFNHPPPCRAQASPQKRQSSRLSRKTGSPPPNTAPAPNPVPPACEPTVGDEYAAYHPVTQVAVMVTLLEQVGQGTAPTWWKVLDAHGFRWEINITNAARIPRPGEKASDAMADTFEQRRRGAEASNAPVAKFLKHAPPPARRNPPRSGKDPEVDEVPLKGGHLKRRRAGPGKKYTHICPHNRTHALCKECRGSHICKHGRIRAECKECGGSSICTHGRRRYYCKECGGKGFCEHGRQRQSCKECGGSAICTHGRRRQECKECGGSSFCEHGRARRRCKECGGSQICKHSRRRYQCKECGGSSNCEHDRRRNTCRVCSPSNFCKKHGRIKYMCKQCGGKSKIAY